MDNKREDNYYAVTAGLSVIKCGSREECIRQEGFLYGIVEIRGIWLNPEGVPFSCDAVEFHLFDHHTAPFMLAENGWKVIGLSIKPLSEGHSKTRIIPAMNIVDPLGNVQEITAAVGYYEGIIDLHRLLRYVSKCPDWNIANERRSKMGLKKIFVKLKNGGVIDITLFKNPDEDYSIRLSFEQDTFVMHSCIIEGDEYIDAIYKEEEFKSDDFYHFMDVVYEKFPTIDIFRRIKL